MTSKRLRWALLIVLVVIASGALAAVFGVRRLLVEVNDPSVPQGVPASWATFRTSAGHKAHVGKKKKDGQALVCKDCHAVDEKGFENPGPEPCRKCHEDQVKVGHVGEGEKKTTCLTCHSFSPQGPKTCISCHQEASGKTHAIEHHNTKDAPCTDCHKPHKDPQVQPAACANCHEKIAKDGRHGPGKCPDCHAPHTGKNQALATCTTASCHSPQSNALFSRGRPIAAGAIVPAKAGSDGVAPRGTGHEACSTCHEPHAFAKDAVKRCDGCHADHTGVSRVGGHASCTGCHAPHSPREPSASCSRCHGGKQALASSRVPAHQACASCHSPHRPERSPASACQNCHSTVHPSHGNRAACTTCHAAHPPGGGGAPSALACASCHKQASSDHAFHSAKTTCMGCHKPHAFGATAGKGTATDFCAGCHGAQASATRQNKGHQECKSCHGPPHAPKPVAGNCATCHSAQASTAPKGHSNCALCHETHSGQRKPVATNCMGCHTRQAASKHGQLAGPNICNSCHRAHGPKGTAGPPPCTNCHTRPPFGAHKASGHRTCINCHSGHQLPSANRKTCTAACHTNMRSHQPTADVCNGCHGFRP